MKICKDCQQHLPAEAFAKNAKNGDGLYTYCRLCAAARKAAYRAERAEEEKARNLDWYRRNKDKSNATSRAYHQRNRERRLQQLRDYYRQNQEQMQARSRAAHAELADHYVRYLLMPRQTVMLRSELPNSLVQAKRLQMMIKRATERTEDEKC
jgi:hypothetical protein